MIADAAVKDWLYTRNDQFMLQHKDPINQAYRNTHKEHIK